MLLSDAGSGPHCELAVPLPKLAAVVAPLAAWLARIVWPAVRPVALSAMRLQTYSSAPLVVMLVLSRFVALSVKATVLPSALMATVLALPLPLVVVPFWC